MKEVDHDKGLYTEEEFDTALANNKERQAEAAGLSDEDAKQITAITLMRIYDMLGAILTHLDEDQAEAILAKHANGELVGPLPALNL
jgi:hypothetical protein